MALGFALLGLLSAVPGSYETIEVTDPHVTAVRAFLDSTVPKLFPNVKGDITIQLAELQIVAGYNLKLHVTAPRGLSFSLVLHVDPSQVIKLVAIQPLDNSRMIGGYKWVDVHDFSSDDFGALLESLREQNGFTGIAKSILAVRTQVVSGLNTHVIFTDVEGVVHSMVVYRNVRQERKVTFYNAIK
jgi:hypothetical protein